MAYIKIADRNLKKVKIRITSQKGSVTKMIREDRVNQYVSDFVLFNNLKGKPYLVGRIYPSL